ncbi:MAG: DUF262 domain-containing protein [Sinimarinibacterium sp.]|jgi:hypothetical protein
MTETNEIEVEETESADEEAFVTYDIAAYPADYTLSVIAEMWSNGDIVVPPFQRKFVWTQKQSSLLIESLLMGLPVPQAFFYVDADSKNSVIDGLQRLMSIVYFFQGYFGEESYQGKKAVFRLTGLSERSPYNKLTFSELSESDQRKLRGRVLRVINIRQLGPKEDDTSAYHIFERLNTGGTPLTAQEIRHCVYHGPIVELLSRLNKVPQWRKIVGKSVLDKHQKDVELVLRVLAVATQIDQYEKPMKEFLNRTMAVNRNADSDAVKRFADRFPMICDSVVKAMGEIPFNIHGRLNASALDSVMGTLVGGDGGLPDDLGARYKALLEDQEFLGTLSVSTSDTIVVRKRVAAVRRHLVPG